MSDDRPDDWGAAGPDLVALIQGLAAKLDTVAGATAAVAGSQRDLLAQLAAVADTAAHQRDDLALALDVLARIAEALERSDARTEDRLAALRDAAAIPVADLQTVLSARADRSDTQLRELADRFDEAVARLGSAPDTGPAEGAGRLAALADAITEQVAELGEVVRGLSWKLPELAEALAALHERVEHLDVAGPVSAATEELAEQLTDHTDRAMVGVLRLIDERLGALRSSVTDLVAAPPPPQQATSGMGFEAGAVMGAAQAAWNRLEQRLDNEFDDLGRQLQAMGTLIEQALATAEAAANRPVVSGEQLRKTAVSMREALAHANRVRRERRGAPRSLPPATDRPGSEHDRDTP